MWQSMQLVRDPFIQLAQPGASTVPFEYCVKWNGSDLIELLWHVLQLTLAPLCEVLSCRVTLTKGVAYALFGLPPAALWQALQS